MIGRFITLIFSFLFILTPMISSNAQDNDKIRVALYDSHPNSFTNTDGNPAGLYVDLLNEIALREGWELEYEFGTWDQQYKKLKAGDVDLLVAIAYTEERDKFLDYPKQAIQLIWGTIYGAEGTAIESILDLAGKRVGLLAGDIHGENFQELIRRFNVQLETVDFPSYSDMSRQIVAGKVDFGVFESFWGDKNQDASGIIKTPVIFNPVRLTFASPGGTNEHVLQTIDRYLVEWQKDKTSPYHRYYSKWMHSNVVAENSFLTQQEWQWLESHPVIRVSNEMDWPPFNYMQDGQPAGYSIDMMDRVEDMLGVRFEYANGLSRNDLMKRLSNPEQMNGIDVMSVIYINESRKDSALFTRSYYKNQPAIVTRRDEGGIRSLSDLANRRVAMPRDYALFAVLSKEVPSAILIDQIDGIPIQNDLEMLKAVAAGQADAAVESGAVLSHIIASNALSNLKIVAFPRFKYHDVRENDLYAAVRKDWPIFHGILNKAISQITREEKTAWVKRWINPKQSSVEKLIPFSAKESEWLAQHGTVTYCVDPNWMPYERINEEGVYEGMIADFIQLVSNRLDIPFRLHPTVSWPHSLEALNGGDCDVITAATSTGPRREWLDFTRPHLESPLVIAVRSEELFVENLAAIRDKTVGVVKGYAHIDLIHERYSNLKITEVENVVDGLRRVETGELFGFVDTVATISYAMRQEDILGLKIGGRFDISIGLSMALQKGKTPHLLSILDKAVDSFSEKEKQELSAKWYAVIYERGIDYSLLWQVMAIGGGVILIFLFWNRKLASLNRKVVLHEDELLKATEELVRSKHILETIIEIVDHGILMSDGNGRVAAFNSNVARMLELPIELLGSKCDWHEITRYQAEQGEFDDDGTKSIQYWSDIRTNAKDPFIYTRQRPNGVELEVWNTPIPGGGWLQTFSDITKRKQAEVALTQSKDEAELANRTKSEFLANMSHEIRTPLNAILGLTNLSLDTRITDKQRGYLEKTDQSAKSLLGVINDILDLSKIEAGKLDIDHIPFDLHEVIEHIHGISAHEALRKGLEFNIKVDDTVPQFLIGDPNRLLQILTNLTGNALKFTEEGCVDIEVHALENSEVSTRLAFCVRDTGIGISPQDQKKLFEKFSQVDASITRRFGGSGLGLAICRRLANLMGGEIDVDSETGEGSTFTVSLPFDLAKAEDIETKTTTLPVDMDEYLRGSRVLLVEDTVINQGILSEVMEKWGVVVEVVDNGQAAIECINSVEDGTFDIILMDVQMPIMDGYEATRRIRERHKDLPIIAITAHAMDEHRKACLEAGMNDHLAKPIESGTLLSMLLKWLIPGDLQETLVRKPVPRPLRPSRDTISNSRSQLPHTLPGFDIADGLRLVADDVELYRKFLLDFPNWTEGKAEEIGKALDKGNRKEAETIAHTLRGTAASIRCSLPPRRWRRPLRVGTKAPSTKWFATLATASTKPTLQSLLCKINPLQNDDEEEMKDVDQPAW